MKLQAPAKAPRQANIELLRIIAMLGVVILHYNSTGGGLANVPPGGASMCLLYGLEGLFICCVDLFLLITGYFSCTGKGRGPGKALGLMLQVIVFQFVSLAIRVGRGQAFTLRAALLALIPDNYFVTLYVAVYFLSPYLNILLEKLSRQQLKGLLVTSLVLFSFFPTAADCLDALLPEAFPGISFVSIHGSINGYTIVNFCLMYLVGACVRLLDIRLKKRYSAPLLALTALLLSLWGYFDNTTGLAWSYANPLVILEAVAAFALMQQLQFRSRLVCALSAGAFTCFLLHSSLLYLFEIPEAVRRPVIFVALHILFTTVTIYLVSYIAYRIYNLVGSPVAAALDRLLQKPDKTQKQEETL